MVFNNNGVIIPVNQVGYSAGYPRGALAQDTVTPLVDWNAKLL